MTMFDAMMILMWKISNLHYVYNNLTKMGHIQKIFHLAELPLLKKSEPIYAVYCSYLNKQIVLHYTGLKRFTL